MSAFPVPPAPGANVNSEPAGGTGSWQTFMPFAWSNGAALTNDDGTEYTIDSPEMTEALEYYKSFFDDGISHWPQRLYERLGFETVGRYSRFLKPR